MADLKQAKLRLKWSTTISKAAENLSAKPDGVGAVSQRSIPTGKQSLLQTRIAMTEGALLCMPTKSSAHFWNWKGRFASIY
jgi:hypothetical protein